LSSSRSPLRACELAAGLLAVPDDLMHEIEAVAIQGESHQV
jgi:hypothetical protein